MTKSREVIDIYSNHARIGVSTSDLTIVFGKLVEASVGISSIEEQATVRMSPQQFKSFIDQSTKTLAAWETVFGKVSPATPPQSQDKIMDGIRRLKEAVDKANS